MNTMSAYPIRWTTAIMGLLVVIVTAAFLTDIVSNDGRNVTFYIVLMAIVLVVCFAFLGWSLDARRRAVRVDGYGRTRRMPEPDPLASRPHEAPPATPAMTSGGTFAGAIQRAKTRPNNGTMKPARTTHPHRKPAHHVGGRVRAARSKT